MGQWCDKEGIKYFTIDTIKELNYYMKTREKIC